MSKHELRLCMGLYCSHDHCLSFHYQKIEVQMVLSSAKKCCLWLSIVAGHYDGGGIMNKILSEDESVQNRPSMRLIATELGCFACELHSPQ